MEKKSASYPQRICHPKSRVSCTVQLVIDCYEIRLQFKGKADD